MKVEVDREETIRFAYQCDLCGKISTHKRFCCICSRDICSDCTKFDPRSYGDCPDKYCLDCFKIGEKYIDRMNEEEKRHDSVIEEIDQEWRDEAMKAFNSKKIENKMENNM